MKKRIQALGCLVITLALLAGCGSSSGGSGPSSHGGLDDESSNVSPDVGCSDEFPIRLDVDTEFTLAVRACEAADGRSGFITNLTKGVIAIHRQVGSPAVTFIVLDTDSLSLSLTRAATMLGDDGDGGFRLGPKATVDAYADVEGGPQLFLEFDGSGSVSGFAASYVADYFEKAFSTPGQSLLQAGGACISGVTDFLQSLSGRAEDLIDALFIVNSCRGLYQDLVRLGDAPSERDAAEALVQSARRFGPAWDEVFSYLGKTISLVR